MQLAKTLPFSLKNCKRELEWIIGPLKLLCQQQILTECMVLLKKARKEAEKVDSDRVNLFSIIASFPAMKSRIDRQCMLLENKIDMLIGNYQLDCDDAYAFSRDKRYAFFQPPFQVHHWSKADALFAVI